MRRIRRAKASDTTPFEDKASNTNRKHEENSDGDSVRNNFAIFSSKLHRSVWIVNAKQKRSLVPEDIPTDTDSGAKAMYAVTMRCK
jgi:hypothetical protein